MQPPFKVNNNKPSQVSKNLIARLTQLLNQAVQFQAQGEYSKARSLFQQVVKLQPTNYECWHIWGIFEFQICNFEEAFKIFKKVIALNSKFPAVYSNFGLVLQELKDFEKALLSYDQAISLDPYLYAARNNRGNVLKELGRVQEALKSYELALTCSPEYPEGLYNVAESYKALHNWNASLLYYNRAISAKVDYFEAHNNRGLMLQFLNKIDEAIESFDQAISINPSYAPAHSNKSLALLLKGDFQKGWEEHEWRWKMEEFTAEHRNFINPRWLGEGLGSTFNTITLSGKSILIHCEQGLGDTLQFCRYVPLVLKTGANVIFEVQEALFNFLYQQPIFKSFPLLQLVRQGDLLPLVDYQCPLISLPFALKELLQEIPVFDRYLVADDLLVEKWINQINSQLSVELNLELQNIPSKHKKLKIGWVWSGNINHRNDKFRSLPLKVLFPLLQKLTVNFEVYSLQKEFRDGDLEIINSFPEMKLLSEHLTSFEQTAAACACMDVVITVDTSIAHLAGALGKKTFVMLPFAPDWRWMLGRSDSPWYPSVKLFRQQSINDWEHVLENIYSDLVSHGD